MTQKATIQCYKHVIKCYPCISASAYPKLILFIENLVPGLIRAKTHKIYSVAYLRGSIIPRVSTKASFEKHGHQCYN
jgi:hypothetical protein